MHAQSKWWVYQNERFPVMAHGPLIAAFSLSAVCFSTLLRDGGVPALSTILVAFTTSFIFFLQLRIADEFKDFEEDSRYRPYRPVPRGLITLPELGVVFAVGALIQLSLALWHHSLLAAFLLITWIYLTGMCKEFFVRDWLKHRPITYMVSHMAIMPLVDLYVTACDWLEPMGSAPDGLFWFLIVSFFNGIVIEIGRKIRAPEDEEVGVETYSFLWGRARAVGAWWLVMALTAGTALLAASNIHFVRPMAVILLILLAGGVFMGQRFLNQPVTARAAKIETYSGIWTLFMYLSLGVFPLMIHLMGQ